MKVADDVGVSKGRKDLEFGVQLLSLFLGHLQVADLLAAEDHAIGLSSNLSDDPKGAMTYNEGDRNVSSQLGTG